MNYPVPVSDALSNLNDQLANAARLIGRSNHRQAIFEAVYSGKKQVKTVEEISKKIGISQVHVLKEGGKMAGFLIEKVPGGYKKKKEFSTLYKKILSLAGDKNKLEQLPTKISSRNGGKINVIFPPIAGNAQMITVDELESFSKIKKQPPMSMDSIAEDKIKEAFKKIIGEKGIFKDWGGEKSDLYTTKLLFKKKRVAVAIAFKGKGTRKKLVPSKMGTNGDQIDRLFDEPAQVFLVVYCGQIDPSIVSQMQAFAIAKKAMAGRKVYYGVIDADDLGRIYNAYPECFN